MSETTTPTPSWTPPSWSTYASAQIKTAWEILDDLYSVDPTHPLVAGARAAAEWSMGMSPVSPTTNERTAPDLLACQREATTAAMRERGIGLPDVATTDATFRRKYARGVYSWLFWWTGTERLPSWFRRATTPDPGV